MIKEELYGGREDGKVINLPDYLPTEVHLPSINVFDLVSEIENSDDPTQPFVLQQSIYKLDSTELKYKYAGEVQ